MNYRKVIVTRRGGVEGMQVVEDELPAPAAGQVSIKILASSVGRTDIHYRYGRSPLSPKIPFVPGYQMVGEVQAVGRNVKDFKVGDHVAALTGTGSNAEMILLSGDDLVHVPDGVAVDEAAIVILNYVTAYQMLHRAAGVQAGESALLVGASGGVGTALMELGRLAGLKLYGLASAEKHALLASYGVSPIDYRHQDFTTVLEQAEPAGVKYVFDGMGGHYTRRAMYVLQHGGKLVGYAPPPSLGAMLVHALHLVLLSLWPDGKSATFYGISALYARDKQPFKEDLPKLFKLLEEGKIKPVIHARFPLLEAAKAQALLESGEVGGNIALLAAGLME